MAGEAGSFASLLPRSVNWSGRLVFGTALINPLPARRSTCVSGVAHASRMLVSASRRNNLFERWGSFHGVHASRKVRDRERRSPARVTRALPGKGAQIGGGVRIFCRERFDVADFDVNALHARPFCARAEKPTPAPDHARSVKCISGNQKLHALSSAQVRSDYNMLGTVRFRAALALRWDHRGSSDKADRCGCGAGAPARPA